MKDEPFYAEGLRFSCKRCSACCRYESGYVFLSQNDLSRLAAFLRMDEDEFAAVYCRHVAVDDGAEKLSLKEKSNYDCIFWKDGCAVYEARPLSCKSYPFWPSMLGDKKVWELATADCPGVGEGELHGRAEIEKLLQMR